MYELRERVTLTQGEIFHLMFFICKSERKCTVTIERERNDDEFMTL